MNAAEATLAVLAELKRQRVEGKREVFVEEESLSALAKLFENAVPEQGGMNEVAPKPIQTEVKKPGVVPVKEAVPEVIASEKKTVSSDFPSPPQIKLPDGDKMFQWNSLKEKVMGCEVCNRELNPQGKVVFGVGDLDADIFFCGEAPGADEEKAGEPFVGPAGELLNRIIEAMGISRDAVYIGNILNWRPRHDQVFGNRPPTQEEMSFCLPYLKAQIEIVKPKVLVTLGKTATDGLLGHDPKRRLSDFRGKWNQVMEIPMMVTYHPSYLLHNPSKSSKRKVWDDMLLVMEKLEMKISEKQRAFFNS